MPRFSGSLFCSLYKNFPKKFVEKEKGTVPKKIFRNRFGAPDIVQYEIHPEEYTYHETKRPWEFEAKQQQLMTRKDRVKGYWWKNQKSWEFKPDRRSKLTEDQWFIFRGDRVEIMVGRDKGRQGTVNRIIREKDLCLVKYIEVGGGETGFTKQLLLQEKPLNFVKGEVRLVDPEDHKPTDVEWRWNEHGDKIRISVRSQREIQIPSRELEALEYLRPSDYKECSKDTRADDVTKVTYVPRLDTFENEILEELGIKDDAKYKKSYWY